MAADRRPPPSIDRLSQLPDPILHRILSPLPTLQVVRTCILSKRWRNLWASVPHLRFLRSNTEDIYRDTKDDHGLENIDARRFIDMTLLLRDLSHIQTFEIDDIETDDQVLDRWIRYAAIRQVQNLRLSSNEVFDQWLPLRIFSCQFLTTLYLHEFKCGEEEITDSIRLPTLTKLQLDSMWFEDNSLVNLISGCPALQHLIMDCCNFDQLHISSHQLKEFELFDLSSCEFGSGFVITISAPSLVYLYIDSGTSASLYLKDVSSLVSAYITFYPEPQNKLIVHDMLQLYNVQHLYLGGRMLERISGQIVSLNLLPKFPCLKQLEVATILDGAPIQAITCLLQCTSNLEHLSIIENGDPYDDTFYKKKWELRETPANFLRNLKLLEVKSYKPSPDAYAFVSFLISNADALERIVFPWRPQGKQKVPFIPSRKIWKRWA